MAASETRKENKVPFFKNMVNRRVPQIIGIYIGVGWGIIQFAEWLVDRYMFSPYLIDLTFFILLSLIPSSIIVAYYHGKPGRDRWKKVEKIGIPLNVVIAAILIILNFSGKDLGSVSRKVTLEDETGKTIERSVPKSRFRKKLSLFYFQNKTGDTSLDWLQYGVSYMLAFDLDQDIFLETLTPDTLRVDDLKNIDFYIYNKMKKAGYKKGTGLPLLLKKKIAGEIHMDYFLSGEISRQGEDFILESSLYHTKNARVAAKNTVRGKDIFKLIDDLSVRIKEGLEIPGSHIEAVVDLPVAEAFTHSLPAARSYTLGRNAMALEKDWSGAQQHLDTAIREDPTFAAGYNYMSSIYSFTNQTGKLSGIIQPLMQHSYKLPERSQLYVKMIYYSVKKKPAKQLAVLRMIIKLYPEDLKAHSFLAMHLALNNQTDEAIATYRRMLEIDPQRYEIYKKIGALYEEKGEFDRALEAYKKYAQHFPQKPESFRIIGGLNRKRGNLEQAKEYYEKVLLLEPGNITVLTQMAEIEMDWGNFAGALRQLEEALQLSQTAKDRSRVYRSLTSFYGRKGQMEKALEYNNLYINASGEFSPPLLVITVKIFTVTTYIEAGKEEEAFRILAALDAELPPSYDDFVSIGYLMAYLELEKPGEAEKRLPAMQNIIKAYGIEQFRALLHGAEGKIHEMRGEYEDALKSYEARLKITPTAAHALRAVGRCCRELKQYKKAEDYIRRTLIGSPFNPQSNYELALVYLDMGDKEKAAEHLEKALGVWKDADANYKPAQKAKEKLALCRD